MKIVYSPRYRIDIGQHVFPTIKYQLVWQEIQTLGLAAARDLTEPLEASWDELALAHTARYLNKLQTGDFSVAELAQLELPWSVGLREGFRLMTGGTIEAARLAANGGGAVHLGGGFHHAFANHGEGFCLFNDVAVALRVLQRETKIRRVAIVDCDVHHGNGTSMIFALDPDVFTFSIHQQYNYPAFKPPGSLDVALPDGAGDDRYLNDLKSALQKVVAWRPEFVFYLAGADPYRDDQLGGLKLTQVGLKERDRLVFENIRAAGVPFVVTLAGGYARRIEDTVAIHVATVQEAIGGLLL